jgi:hypothetical protein
MIEHYKAYCQEAAAIKSTSEKGLIYVLEEDGTKHFGIGYICFRTGIIHFYAVHSNDSSYCDRNVGLKRVVEMKVFPFEEIVK